MKLLELDLHAYGSFSDFRLDLSGGSKGLHIVYGPNEAGKSSALRAMRAFLYGVPARTDDAFIHSMSDLRVGGRLCNGDGKEITLYRRKGNKNTLLDGADGNPVDDQVLAKMLDGVDQPVFEKLFGIDHQELVDGGRTLLLEHGREAEALFGSGLGSTTVHALRQKLDTEATELFKPSGSKPQINQLLSELKDIEKRQRQLSLSGRQWDEARKAKNRAISALQAHEQSMDEFSRQRTRLERIRRTLPALAKQGEVQTRLDELKGCPALPVGFADNCDAAITERAAAVGAQRKAKSLSGNLKAQISEIKFSQELLDRADVVDALRERLGSYRKANSDLPARRAEKAADLKAAKQRLNEIRPGYELDQFGELRATLAGSKAVIELGSRRQGLEDKLEAAEAACEEARAELAESEKVRKSMNKAPVADELRAAVKNARKLGEIDDSIAQKVAALASESAAVHTDLASLGLWQSDPGELMTAPLPLEASVRKFVADERRLAESRAGAEKARESASGAIRAATEALRELELTGAVPTEAQLADIRGRRDFSWRLLRSKWLESQDVDAEAQALGGTDELPAVLDESIQSADEIADRLRREAKTVHESAAAHARLEQAENELRDIEAQLEIAVGAEKTFHDTWHEIWSAAGVAPLSPEEMLAWLQQIAGIRARMKVLQSRQAELDADKTRGAAAVARLREELQSCGGSIPNQDPDLLQPLLELAEDRLEELESARAQLQQLDDRCARLKQDLGKYKKQQDKAKENLAAWQKEWRAEIERRGLAEASNTGDVVDYLNAVDWIAGKIDEAEGLEGRITAIHADSEQFKTDARALLEGVAPDLAAQELDEALPQLARRLNEHRQAATRHETLAAQLLVAQEEMRDAEASVSAIDETLGALCKQAGCEEPTQLMDIAAKAAERDRLRAELGAIASGLLDNGDGLTIEQLAEEAKDIDRDGLALDLERVIDKVNQELLPENQRLVEEKLEATRAFEEMTGGDEAALLAETAQQLIAEIRSRSEQYVRARVASRILRDQIEEFRQKNRNPILARASKYFGQLTCGAFSEIATALDDADQPVLMAIRTTGERLRVEAMSTGTRDQLYLALRLAALDHRLDSSEPIPFIVDDILIQFDDARSAATLSALAEFSSRTQVILFTHHRQVVELAHNLPDEKNGVFVHELA